MYPISVKFAWIILYESCLWIIITVKLLFCWKLPFWWYKVTVFIWESYRFWSKVTVFRGVKVTVNLGWKLPFFRETYRFSSIKLPFMKVTVSWKSYRFSGKKLPFLGNLAIFGTKLPFFGRKLPFQLKLPFLEFLKVAVFRHVVESYRFWIFLFGIKLPFSWYKVTVS